jgi:hypothetical protein
MLSYKRSDNPIAIIRGGKQKGQIIYLHREFKPENMIECDVINYLEGDDFRQGRQKLPLKQISEIYRALQNGYELDTDNPLQMEYYEKAKKDITRKQSREFKLVDSGQLEPYPSLVKDQRQFIYVVGPSGVGKSTWTSFYIKNYHRAFPSNPVYIFSQKKEDKAFDIYEFVERVIIDDEWLQPPPLLPDDFSNSLCVFDDIENIPNDKVKVEVYKLKDAMLETGRSLKINVIVCCHLGMNFHSTRKDLNELSHVVMFKEGTSYHMNQYLKKYAGLTNTEIKRLRDLPSRWFMLSSSFPAYVLTENQIFFTSP